MESMNNNVSPETKKFLNEMSDYIGCKLYFYGSVQRADFFPEDSDIDILVDFQKSIGIEFIDLADELEILLHHRVDLVSRKGIKPQYYQHIEKELRYV